MDTSIRSISRRSLFGVLGLAVLVMATLPEATAQGRKGRAAAGKAVGKSAERATATPTEQATSQVLQIELAQNLPPNRAKALQDLVDRFNAQSGNAQVRLVEANAGKPHMMILGGAEQEAFLAAKPARYKPLFAVMKEAGTALVAVKPAAMVTRKPVNAAGQLLALPVGLNTPVLFFNNAALVRARVNPDTLFTWADIQGALNKLGASGSGCSITIAEPARVLIENVSAWNNVPVFSGKQASFNGIFHVRFLSQIASWYRANALKIFKDATEAEERFARGECALYVGPSDSWAYFRQKGVDAGVTRLPYVADAPGAQQNTLADGVSLWVASGKKATEYKVVASFVNFWLNPENQITWQRDAGYLPLSKAGIFATDSKLLGDELANNKVAIGQLTNRQVTSASSVSAVLERDSVRNAIDAELADVWADRKSAKAALDSAVKRVSK